MLSNEDKKDLRVLALVVVGFLLGLVFLVFIIATDLSW